MGEEDLNRTHAFLYDPGALACKTHTDHGMPWFRFPETDRTQGGTLARRARAGRVPGIFCDPCPAGGLLLLICWATLYGFAPWPPGHQQMF